MHFETAHCYCKSLDKLLLKRVDSGQWKVDSEGIHCVDFI